jgi:ADP-ribose pyrophosphatase YjhB (NUDIX family)
MVLWREKLLMCLRAHEPGRGEWALPSGFLECGETLQEGAARETAEETGVIVDPASMDLFSVTNMVRIEQICIVFRSELLTEPVIRRGSECLDAAFLSEDEISRVDVAWQESMGNRNDYFFKQVRTRQFDIHLVSLGSPEGEKFGSRDYSIVPDTPDDKVVS